MSFSMSGGEFTFNRFDEFEKHLLGEECKDCGDDCDCDDCSKKKSSKKSKKSSGKKPDFLDVDKDGDKEEDMEDAIEDKGGAVSEGIDFKAAKRIDDAREKAQAEKDKKNPSGKDRRLALRKFRPGASHEERADGHRDNMREKGTSPIKNGKKMFEEIEAAGLFTTEELENLQELFGLGKNQTPEEKTKKDREKKINELERLTKHLGNPLSDVNTSKSMKAKMKKEEVEEVEEGYKPTNFEKNERQAYKHRKAEEDAVRRGDEEGANKHMKRRTALGSPLAKRTELINQGKGPANEMTRKARSKSMKEAYDEMYMEVYKGKHGQSDKEYMDSRSDAGKRISGDSKEGPASYSTRIHKNSPPTLPGEKPKNVPGLSKDEKAELAMRKANLKKEEVNLDEDSRRMSNKQHTARVRSNIKDFGSNYTPPSNYDPDANRGKGEVLTRKQMEKKRRKSLRQEELEATGAFSAEELEALQEKMSAMDIVRKQVEDKYGKGAIHDPKAPKKEVSPEEKKRRAAEEAKNRADRRKEAGYDPMHSARD